MKRNLHLPATLLALCLVSGCSTFTTTQIDERYENGEIATRIKTVVKSKTLWDSDSQLANFKASQTEKSQGATVGSLTQSATSTNVVDALKEINSILSKVHP